MSTRMARSLPNQKEISRITVGGRKLTYQLKVIQEPERARACGSGAKSSADRRPVDPPPVVELRIFEGDGPEKEDVTFAYSANFFLFATLEVARPIANGRVHHPPPPQQVPVLTGMPVSGMAYLDRPTEAGYFIFPDLSVRHEGSYKLSFNLYEETKHADDVDADSSHEKRSQIPAGSAVPDSSFDWRLEVKSHAFTVYSAKKFPGLSESTALSRTVAEQGCRVRIRRDVRMRRRDGKGQGEWDEVVAQPDSQYIRGRTTDQEPYNSSLPPSQRTSISPDGSRRNPNDPNQPNGPYSASSGPVLGFGAAQAQQPYHNATFATPSFATPIQPAHVPQQPQPYQQAPASQSYPQQIQPQQPYHGQQPPRYDHDRQQPQSAYPSFPPREPYEPEPRRASVAYPPSHTATRDYPPVESTFNRPQPYQSGYSRPRSPPPPAKAAINLPPIIAARPVDKAPQPSPLAPVHTIAHIAPYPSEAYDRAQERPGAYAPLEARSTKRAYDSVFKSSADQPLYNRQRPATSADDAVDDDEEMDLLKQKMIYKRANGIKHHRNLPLLE